MCHDMSSNVTMLRPFQLLSLFCITDEIRQKLLEITFFGFKKLGKNLSVRVMRNKDDNWNGLNWKYVSTLFANIESYIMIYHNKSWNDSIQFREEGHRIYQFSRVTVRVRGLTVSCEMKTIFHGFWAPNCCKEHWSIITGCTPNNNITITGNYW